MICAQKKDLCNICSFKPAKARPGDTDKPFLNLSLSFRYLHVLPSQTHQNMQISLTISPSKAPLILPSHHPISISSPSPRIQRVSLQTHVGPVNSLKGSGYSPGISRAIEEEEYRLARSQVARKGLDLEGYAIEGISIGGQETCIIIPEFKCTFDIGRCPSRAIQQNFVFITHAHLDHIVSSFPIMGFASFCL